MIGRCFALEVDYEIGGVFDPTTGVITGTAEYGRDDGLDAAAGGNGAPNGALEEGDRSYLDFDWFNRAARVGWRVSYPSGYHW